MSTHRSGPSKRYLRPSSVRTMLLEALRDGMRAGRSSPAGIGSSPFRACVVLYWLLLDHQPDQWGRCQACRRPGSLFGARWRQCHVYDRADLVERMDEVLLLGVLDDEFGLAVAPPAAPGPAPHRVGDDG